METANIQQQFQSEFQKDARDALIHLIEQLQNSVHKLSEDFRNHTAGLDAQREEIISKVLNEAFVNGDAKGHKEEHAIALQAAKKRAEFWEKMLFELCKWGLFGFLGWAIYSLWTTFLQGPHK